MKQIIFILINYIQSQKISKISISSYLFPVISRRINWHVIIEKKFMKLCNKVKYLSPSLDLRKKETSYLLCVSSPKLLSNVPNMDTIALKLRKIRLLKRWLRKCRLSRKDKSFRKTYCYHSWNYYRIVRKFPENMLRISENYTTRLPCLSDLLQRR